MENIPLPWPSPSDLEQLVDLSRGSLLFALKIVDFVTNGNQLPSENFYAGKDKSTLNRPIQVLRRKLEKSEQGRAHSDETWKGVIGQ